MEKHYNWNTGTFVHLSTYLANCLLADTKNYADTCSIKIPVLG